MCRTWLLFLLFPCAVLAAPCQSQADLARFHDKNRVLLVFASSASDPRWRRQDALLSGSQAQFADRDLLRFDIFERGPSRGAGVPLSHRAAQVLHVRYHVHPGTFRVLLVGKDGHVAFGGPTPISLRDLTGRIDRMPMRRDEMRRRDAGIGR